MAKEDDILRDAIIGTDKEIASSAWDQEDLSSDDDGDKSLEMMGDGLEGQREPEEDDEGDEDGADEATEVEAKDGEAETDGKNGDDKAEAEAATKEAPESQQDRQGRVPAGRLREQSERARAAEAERDALKAQLAEKQAESDRKLAELTAKMEGFMQAARQAPQPAPKPAEAQQPEAAPDLFEDPKAYLEYVNKTIEARTNALQEQMRRSALETNLQMARVRHGQTYEAAESALKGLDFRNPENVDLVKRLENSPNPGEALVAWHKRNEVLREVGEDPAAYKARIAEETRKALAADPTFRQELLAALRGEAETGDNGRPRTITRLPPALARASGNSGRNADLDAFDGSESAIAASAWK